MPFVEADDAVHLGRDAFIMSGDQRRASLAPDEVEELGEDDVRRGLVKVAGRLIGKNGWRGPGQPQLAAARRPTVSKDGDRAGRRARA